MDAQRRELEDLRLELARARGQIEELRVQLEVRSLEPTDLREVAQNLEQQLVERDEELEKLRAAVREGDAWRREMEAARQATEESFARGIEALRAELELVKSTRLWRVGERYWDLKASVRQVLGRRSQ
jgi:chromosome segregation ATPase